MKKTINLQEKVAPVYQQIWNNKNRYLFLNGSRASGKSSYVSLKIVYSIMRNPLSNAVIVRRYFNSHKNSTFAQISWAIEELGVSHLWKRTINPLQYTYEPTGQVIIFAGLDHPEAIKSLTVAKGYLTTLWIEEATNLESEQAFNTLDLSIRGQLPNGYFHQIIMSTNPGSQHHWIYKRFIQSQDPFTTLLNSTYKDNPWLSDADRAIYEYMRENNPERYAIDGEGQWLNTEGQVFTNWAVQECDEDEMNYSPLNEHPQWKAIYGLDFGFTNDPTAIVKSYINNITKEIYIADVIYEYHLTNPQISNLIKYKRWDKELIICDSAEPKSIKELQTLGIRCKGAKKGKDSIIAGIKKLQEYNIYINPLLKDTISEFQLYRYGDSGKIIDANNHSIDALRYSMQGIKSNIEF